jgi:hypothetical protein
LGRFSRCLQRERKRNHYHTSNQNVIRSAQGGSGGSFGEHGWRRLGLPQVDGCGGGRCGARGAGCCRRRGDGVGCRLWLGHRSLPFSAMLAGRWWGWGCAVCRRRILLCEDGAPLFLSSTVMLVRRHLGGGAGGLAGACWWRRGGAFGLRRASSGRGGVEKTGSRLLPWPCVCGRHGVESGESLH